MVNDLIYDVTEDGWVSTYKASAYWVSYHGGFIRRGLPGEALRLLTGHAPTRTDAVVLAAVLTASAVAAIIVLGLAITRAVPDALGKLVVGALVVTSPFSYSLLAQEIGRYDSIGWLTIAAVAAIALPVRRPVNGPAHSTTYATPWRPDSMYPQRRRTPSPYWASRQAKDCGSPSAFPH